MYNIKKLINNTEVKELSRKELRELEQEASSEKQTSGPEEDPEDEGYYNFWTGQYELEPERRTSPIPYAGYNCGSCKHFDSTHHICKANSNISVIKTTTACRMFHSIFSV